jgi:iron complex transport system ATP-binding protein
VAILRFDEVGVDRGGRAILDGITFSVREAERWVVLGPNGAGKTTLLQIAATQLFPTRGTVDVLDARLGRVDVFSLRPAIGIASASLAEKLPPGEFVRDVVVTAAWAVTGRWRETYEGWDVDRAAYLLDQYGVGHLAERRFGTLSEGERKRVQLARAMMTDPELLLLDEPAAEIETRGREDLVRRLGALALAPNAPACVLVTHHVEEIPVGYTHAIALRGGRMIAAGDIDAVLTATVLSECFGLPLRIERAADRWSATAR